MYWTKIDPLMPLPAEEVLMVNAQGIRLLGYIERATLTSLYGRNDFQELHQPTHYLIIEKVSGEH